MSTDYSQSQHGDSLQEDYSNNSSTKAEKKGAWTNEEDQLLLDTVRNLGAQKWTLVAKRVPGRSGKSCRLRYCNQLNPNLLKGEYTCFEDALIVLAQQKQGNKWAQISNFLRNQGYNRTDNSIKNHWNSTLKNKADQQAIYQSNEYLREMNGHYIEGPQWLIDNKNQIQQKLNQDKEKEFEKILFMQDFFVRSGNTQLEDISNIQYSNLRKLNGYNQSPTLYETNYQYGSIPQKYDGVQDQDSHEDTFYERPYSNSQPVHFARKNSCIDHYGSPINIDQDTINLNGSYQNSNNYNDDTLINHHFLKFNTQPQNMYYDTSYYRRPSYASRFPPGQLKSLEKMSKHLQNRSPPAHIYDPSLLDRKVLSEQMRGGSVFSFNDHVQRRSEEEDSYDEELLMAHQNRSKRQKFDNSQQSNLNSGHPANNIELSQKDMHKHYSSYDSHQDLSQMSQVQKSGSNMDSGSYETFKGAQNQSMGLNINQLPQNYQCPYNQVSNENARAHQKRVIKQKQSTLGLQNKRNQDYLVPCSEFCHQPQKFEFYGLSLDVEQLQDFV